MRFQRNKNKNAKLLFVPIVGLFVSLFAFPSQQVHLVFADTTTTTPSQTDLQNQKTEKQNELDVLNQQIATYNQQIAVERTKTASLSNEITLYDTEIQATSLQIQATQTNIDNTNLQIQETQQQIDQRNAQIDDEKTVLSQLIITLNEYDGTTGLQLDLGSNTFSDFMDQVQYTQSVQDKVYSLLQQIKDIKAKLQADQATLQTNLDKLKQLNDQLTGTQQSLTDQKSQKIALLTQTKGQQSQYQKLLTSSQTQEAKLNQEMNDLDNQIQGKKGFNSLAPVHGILAWPINGVITQGYGNTGFTQLGYDFHNGLDIAAPAGTPIYAAADGIIEATGMNQEADYGNWVAIRHPAGGKLTKSLITLYGHMRTFVVSKGQAVKQGDLIGYEGNTGNTTRLLYGPDHGYHLHFTVFDADGFGISPGAYQKTYGPYQVPYGYTYNPLDFL